MGVEGEGARVCEGLGWGGGGAMVCEGVGGGGRSDLSMQPSLCGVGLVEELLAVGGFSMQPTVVFLAGVIGGGCSTK